MTEPGRRQSDGLAPRTDPPSSTGTVIVVVDDSPVVLSMLTMLLEEAGYEVVGACDGDDALARIRETSPALVLVDATIPKRDGYEVCQELRADQSLAQQPYVIMLTAGGQASDRERAQRSGVDEFMTKPFSPSKVRERVTMLLGAPSIMASTRSALVEAIAVGCGDERMQRRR